MNRYMGEDDRYRYIQECFGCYISEPILDLGCRENKMSEYYKNVIGVDLGGDGEHTLSINLEDLEDRNRLVERMYCVGTVLASHVIEHLDNPKKIFGMIQQLGPDTVIIGLPNEVNWIRRLKLLQGNVTGKWRVQTKEWERHKWFFEIDTAEKFCDYHMKGFERIDSAHPKFHLDSEETKITTRFIQWMIEKFGSEALRCRDWWGVYQRK